MTDKNLIIVGENGVFESFIKGNLIELDFKVGPDLNSVVICCCEDNLFF